MVGSLGNLGIGVQEKLGVFWNGTGPQKERESQNWSESDETASGRSSSYFISFDNYFKDLGVFSISVGIKNDPRRALLQRFDELIVLMFRCSDMDWLHVDIVDASSSIYGVDM